MGLISGKCFICGGYAPSKLKHGEWICGSCVKRLGGYSQWGRIRHLSISEINKLRNKKNSNQNIIIHSPSNKNEEYYGRIQSNKKYKHEGDNGQNKPHYFRNAAIAITIAFTIALFSAIIDPLFIDIPEDTQIIIFAMSIALFLMTLIGATIYAIVGTIKEHKRKKHLKKSDPISIPIEEKSSETSTTVNIKDDSKSNGTHVPIAEEPSETSTPVDIDEIAHRLYVNKMSGIEFEQFCGERLLESGVTRVEYTATTNDYGADIIAYLSDGTKWVVQCKRYAGRVGNSAVQEVVSAIPHYGADGAIIMTNSELTANAKILAKENGVRVFENIR